MTQHGCAMEPQRARRGAHGSVLSDSSDRSKFKPSIQNDLAEFVP